jgi:hypothetical protein
MIHVDVKKLSKVSAANGNRFTAVDVVSHCEDGSDANLA